MAMLTESASRALGSGAAGDIAHYRVRRKMTSKDLKAEHIYFSDSNYFVWKRVNTITLTTELGGFEGLTRPCFPRRGGDCGGPGRGP